MSFYQKIVDSAKQAAFKAVNFALTFAGRTASEQDAPIGVHRTHPQSDSTDWTVKSALSALREFELGRFREAARMVDAMTGEGRVFSTLDSRVKATLGGVRVVERSLAPNATSKVVSRAIAKHVETWYWEAIPASQHEAVLKQLIMLGFCLCEVSYARRDESNIVYPKITVHSARNVRYDLTREQWLLLTRDHGEIVVTPGDGRWVLFVMGDADRPWLNGAVRPLAFPWLLLRQTIVDWGRRVEFEATGLRKAIVPADYNVERVNKFVKQLKNLGSESVVTVPQGYDFGLVQADLGAAESFAKLADRCDTSITLVLLGQNLTTQIEGGSYAAASTHARVQLERVQADVQTITHTIRTQIVQKWIEFNFESIHRDYAPFVTFDTSPPEDQQKKAQALLTLSQSLAALKAAGADVRAILEAYGVPTVSDSEAIENDVIERTIRLLAAGIITIEEARFRLGVANEIQDI